MKKSWKICEKNIFTKFSAHTAEEIYLFDFHLMCVRVSCSTLKLFILRCCTRKCKTTRGGCEVLRVYHCPAVTFVSDCACCCQTNVSSQTFGPLRQKQSRATVSTTTILTESGQSQGRAKLVTNTTSTQRQRGQGKRIIRRRQWYPTFAGC